MGLGGGVSHFKVGFTVSFVVFNRDVNARVHALDEGVERGVRDDARAFVAPERDGAQRRARRQCLGELRELGHEHVS